MIYVVHPAEVVDEETLNNKHLLQQSLEDLKPVYYEPAFANVITAGDNFTAAENIDMLIVIPGRHGIWHKIFPGAPYQGVDLFK